MKNLLILLSIVFLTSCDENTLITKAYNPKVVYGEENSSSYTITKITQKDRYLSTYYLESGFLWNYFYDNPYLVDSSSKYQIGDKVFITLEKIE